MTAETIEAPIDPQREGLGIGIQTGQRRKRAGIHVAHQPSRGGNAVQLPAPQF
jgi:hypothetical protein